MDRPRPHKPSFYFIAEESADMRKSIRCFAFVVIVLFSTVIFVANAHAQDAKFDSDTISGLGARNIGSAAMSGRVAAIAAVKEDGRLTVYLGAASGGVWKSSNGGTTFKPVFDKESAQSIGAVAIDPQGPKTIWAGTGESWTRNSVSIGNGIYKSTDGGDSWTNMGLQNSEHIAKIIIDPKNRDTVYACVPGKLWSDSEDRGVYKTTDGGKSWNKILKGANLSTGCSMISMNSQGPKTLFAAMWDFRRKGWTFRSGGENATAASGSGFFQTADGGATWKELDEKSAKGLPAKPWGRIAVTIAPAKPNVVYAMIESTRSALFRSDDGSKTWEERDRSNWMVWRPFYFANLIVDPRNENKVYKPDLTLIMSEDGGRSFSGIGNGAHGDFHDVWVNPDNTDHLIACDDGSVWYSYDGGNTWWKGNNLPISQFYHVSVDSADPYHVFGGLQDNSVWIGDSQYPGGITTGRWENIFGGDGFWVFPDPADANYVYAESQGGFIGRVNRITLEGRLIKPQPNYGEGKLRFNWNTPIHLSPNEKGTIYVGAQFLFRSRDHGQSWERISPDLTTNDPEKQKQEESGGVTVDNSSAEMHTTIYAISESPRNGKVLRVGTDDGNIQLTRDGGATWTSVAANIEGTNGSKEALPWAVTGPHGTSGGIWVSSIQASRFDEATAYVTIDRHTFGDMTPYAFRTTDFGRSWTRIAGPEQGVRGYAHVVKEDAVKPGLLFLGTEFGLWISIDGGKQWAGFKGGDFPSVAVRDLAIQEREGELEILDPDGKVIDTIPASKRRGINRVTWTMRVPPPRVPRAAQLAFGASVGPRVLPGTYTARLTKGGKSYETKLRIGLDRRAAYTLEDRNAQFDAAMRVHALFGEMSDVVDRSQAIRTMSERSAAGLRDGDELRSELGALSSKADEIRKKIVATKEGGDITGEERIREHTEYL